MQPGLRVDHQHQKIGFLDRLQHLTLDLEVHRNVRIVGQPAGVDQPELTAVPFGAREMAVARGARLVADDGAVLTDDAVEQRGLADVRTPDERDYGNAHAATAVGSFSRTSMKSYDG